MVTTDLNETNRTRRRWRRATFCYIFVIILGHVLVPIVWGLTNGIILGMKIAPDPAFKEEISAILTQEELKRLENSYFPKFPQEKRAVAEFIVEKYLRGVSWLPIHIVSNLITFAILGLILGLSRVQTYWFIIPLPLLPATLTILNEPFIVTNWRVTLAVVLVVQVSSVYLAAKLGTWTSDHWGISTGQVTI